MREPPGSQTASSWTTFMEQSWRAEKLLAITARAGTTGLVREPV